jgi:hypothetical protein
MFSLVRPPPAPGLVDAAAGYGLVRFFTSARVFGFGRRALPSEQEFSGEQSRQIAALIREEIARRRMSRQQLADKAKLSLSTL